MEVEIKDISASISYFWLYLIVYAIIIIGHCWLFIYAIVDQFLLSAIVFHVQQFWRILAFSLFQMVKKENESFDGHIILLEIDKKSGKYSE